MDTMNHNPIDPLATRPSLLSRIRDTNDQESWREFYNLYCGVVRRFAVGRGMTEAEAQDVVQDTFASVAKSIQGFQYDPAVGSFRSWLFHTTEWRISDQFRKRPHDQAAAQYIGDTSRTAVVERVPDQGGDILQERWDREYRQTLVETALQQVKPEISARQFQIFDLYVIKDWPVTKVARALSVSVSQIYLAKHRIGKLVKKKIKELELSLN